MEYVTFILLRRTDSLTLGIVCRTVLSLGTKFSSLPAVVAITTEKPLVATAQTTTLTYGSVAATVVPLSTEVL